MVVAATALEWIGIGMGAGALVLSIVGIKFAATSARAAEAAALAAAEEATASRELVNLETERHRVTEDERTEMRLRLRWATRENAVAGSDDNFITVRNVGLATAWDVRIKLTDRDAGVVLLGAGDDRHSAYWSGPLYHDDEHAVGAVYNFGARAGENLPVMVYWLEGPEQEEREELMYLPPFTRR